MPAQLNRKLLTSLSDTRIRDARSLLKANRPSGAYYLAGCSVECALKAAIAKQTRRGDFPDAKPTKDSHTHDLTALFKLAGLWPQFEAARKLNAALETNWTVVKDWGSESRYAKNSKSEAADLLTAIDEETNGVLGWITKHS